MFTPIIYNLLSSEGEINSLIETEQSIVGIYMKCVSNGKCSHYETWRRRELVTPQAVGQRSLIMSDYLKLLAR
jgi:hypothetical protein